MKLAYKTFGIAGMMCAVFGGASVAGSVPMMSSPSFAGDNSFEERFAGILDESLSYKVRLHDMLGEGSAAWDSEPRVPSDTVNCMIWLQYVLAKAYARDGASLEQSMDAMRYYQGIVGFGTRKHLDDDWVAFDPGPLVSVRPQACGQPRIHRVKLNRQLEFSSMGYTCPVLPMLREDLEFEYYPYETMIECAPKVEPGHYVMFAVPTQLHLDKFEKISGPMGLVHALILQVRHYEDLGKNIPNVFHAATSSRKILIEPPHSYFQRMGKNFAGYALFRLKPDWRPEKPSVLPVEIAEMLRCEGSLPAGGRKE